MDKIPKFDEENLRAVCNVLVDTQAGLTGSEIGNLLQSCNIDDHCPSQTKRYRLFNALNRRQHQDDCGNNVVAFIYKAMDPVRYTQEPELFDERRSLLNPILSFRGLSLGEDGKLREVSPSRTLSEAQKRAKRLYRELSNRNVHPDVLRFCHVELLQDNHFHAVFEAAKSVADKIRAKSGLTNDGTRLVDDAFGFKSDNEPVLAFNTLQTETEQSEHRGLMNLLKGLFGTFRNTTAHAPKIKWIIKEQDAFDMLTLTSLLHRRLDEAVRTMT